MDKRKTLLVKQLMEEFELKQVTGDEQSLLREISSAEINRPGFELGGFFQYTDFRRLVIFGEKECAYIAQLEESLQIARFKKLASENTPAIIVCKGLECPPLLKQVAMETNFPVFQTNKHTGRLSVAITSYLDEQLAPETLMHGVFMNIHGKGVILRGDSGIGKSEIALELINLGHILIADDCVELYRIGQNIYGRSPSVLANLLEIRGVGVIDVVKMFGVSTILDKGMVDLVIQLDRWVPTKEYTRIGTEEVEVTEKILGIEVPKVIVPVTGGRSMSSVIEAAVNNMRLKELGYDSSKEFVNRILENINNQNRK